MKKRCSFQKKTIQRILGIDPGYGRIGWGVIEGGGNTWKHVAHGCIETDKALPLVPRLASIQTYLQDVMAQYNPTHSAVEELFFYKNVTTGIGVAQARGVILLSLHLYNLPIVEVTPLQVKQAITGYGRAQKGQVQQMIKMLLCLPKKPLQDDAADALAVALTASPMIRMIR